MIYLGIAIGLLLGALIYRFTVTRPQPYFAAAEYWVYIPGEKLPSQDEVMERMVRQNPHGKRGHSPITAKEALLFSDVRLHIALVLRRKNTHVFRPDLFDEAAEVTAETLRALSESKALIKLRYISEVPLVDDRHVQFLAHAADAYGALADAKVIYDVAAERMMMPGEFAAWLDKDLDATQPDEHVRVVWKSSPGGCLAESKGLVKVGVTEIQTGEMEADERVLVSNVLEEGFKQLWELMKTPEQVEVVCFDDRFQLHFQPSRRGPTHVTILRVHPA